MAIIGPNVYGVDNCYANCTNLRNAYVYSNYIGYASGCFKRPNNSNTRLNIYAHDGSTTIRQLIQTYSFATVTGSSMSWVNDYATNGCYYNTSYNIYIYPVANVAAIQEANGD